MLVKLIKDLRSVEITEVISFYYATAGLLSCFKGVKSHPRCYLIGFPLGFTRFFRLEKLLQFIKISSIDFFFYFLFLLKLKGTFFYIS